MQVVVQPADFGFLIDPEAHDRADDLENDKGGDGAIDDGGADAFQLDQNLARVAFQKAAGSADGFNGEDAGQQGAGNAAQPVET